MENIVYFDIFGFYVWDVKVYFFEDYVDCVVSGLMMERMFKYYIVGFMFGGGGVKIEK